MAGSEWIPCSKIVPNEIGSYLVTTARRKVMIDRWDGEMWGMCNPANRRGRYQDHIAWRYIPAPADEKEARKRYER